MINEERVDGGVIWWIRVPRIPESIEDAKSLPQEGSVVFVCDCEIYKGRDTMHRLMRMVERKNQDWTICVWHNHKTDKMITRRKYGPLVHAV